MRAGYRLAGFGIACLPLSACGVMDDGFLNPDGPIAQAQRTHFWFITGLTLLVILPLFVALPIVLRRYRYGRARGRYRPRWDFSLWLECLIWGVPSLVVLIMAVGLWRETHELDPYAATERGAPLEVEVISLDWKWLFLYPGQGVASLDRLVIPAGRPVALRLTSGSVMQSFHIPRLAGQIYTMAGMQTRLHFTAPRDGHYRGLNTQYNGKGFSRQSFAVDAVSPEAFSRWSHSARTAEPLTMTRYRTLAKPSQGEVRTFRLDDRDFFARIMRQYHQPGPPAGIKAVEGDS